VEVCNSNNEWCQAKNFMYLNIVPTSGTLGREMAPLLLVFMLTDRVLWTNVALCNVLGR
jgi:hypothetical protein